MPVVDNYVALVGEELQIDPDRPILSTLFEEYERVLVQSLITSFGLDFLIKDQHGGDVDTIHNVRQIGQDPKMSYKNQANAAAYDSRGKYDRDTYHKHPAYIAKNREVSKQKKNGTLVDAYTGDRIRPNGKSDLDHVMSAKEIHDDRGRVLAGLSGAELANSPDNLQPTNPHTNRSKKQQSMNDYLEQHSGEYTDTQKTNMRAKDAQARKAIDAEINRTYYTSPSFRRDVVQAAGQLACSMAAREVLGLFFAELWFAVKDELQDVKQSLGEWLAAIGNGLKKGFEKIKDKYEKMLSAYVRGAASGILSSITSTLVNTFLTTSKAAVNCIRQAWASIVEAMEVLFLNPDNYLLGDRLRAVLKILATGASVVVGILAGEAVAKTGIQTIPVVGEIVHSFVSVFTSGILSCTLLLVLDRSRLLNEFFGSINKASTIEKNLLYFREQAAFFERFAAELAGLDIEQFARDVRMHKYVADRIERCCSEKELNTVLKRELSEASIDLPWKGDFEDFMRNKKNRIQIR